MESMRTVIRVALVAGLLAACGGNDAPEIEPAPQDSAPPLVQAPLETPDIVAEEALLPVPPPVVEDNITNRSLDDINLDSPFEPVFFGLDSSDLDTGGRAVAATNAEVLRRFPTWIITIEGHCDERGTAEYNLALGERRAEAVRAYLVSLGIAADRVRTVSYGKEFPFDPGHTETAWAAYRRGLFVVTSR
jgi:peptidoglycan-associated lipoprotein